MGEEDQDYKTKKIVQNEQYVSASLEIVQGGKSPKIVLSCKVQADIKQRDKVPDMVVTTIKEVWQKALDQNLI